MHVSTCLITRPLSLRNYKSQSSNNEFKTLLVTKLEGLATVSRGKYYGEILRWNRTKNDGWKHGGGDRLDEMKFNFKILKFYTEIIIHTIGSLF